MNSHLGRSVKTALSIFVALTPVLSVAELVREGGEYNLTGGLNGDQVNPSVAIGATGGYLAWQDNATDGDALGIRALQLDSNLNPIFGAFRISQTSTGDQENVKVRMLRDGGAVFTWQSGPQSNQDVFARILGADGQFVGNEFRVNTTTVDHQENPTVAELQNGNLIFAWESMGQDGHLRGIFAQITSPAGIPTGEEFQVNIRMANNQKSPSIVSLPNGNAMISYVGEELGGFDLSQDLEGQITGPNLGVPTYHGIVYARLLDGSTGNLIGGELALTGGGLHANPSLTVAPNGNVILVCSKYNSNNQTEGWNILRSEFNASGFPLGVASVLNQTTFGDQYQPFVTSASDTSFCVWSSVGQDGSIQSIYGNLTNSSSPEFRVNTTHQLTQKHPAISGSGVGYYLVVWTTYDFDSSGFEIYGQRYKETSTKPAAPSAPFVTALGSAQLSVTWPAVKGIGIADYLLFVDGSAEPLSVQGNSFLHQPLTAGSTHGYSLAYRVLDGSISSISEPAHGTTYGPDLNFDGLPDDWQALYWTGKFPSPLLDSDGDGATNLEEFLSGTDPMDTSSVLKTTMAVSQDQGWFLNWNTTPGFVYQVQVSEDLMNWSNVGEPRFAAGERDSLAIGIDGITGYYRVTRVR